MVSMENLGKEYTRAVTGATRLVAVVALAVLAVEPAHAGPAVGSLAASVQADPVATPDSAHRSVLATDLARARAVRVTGAFGTRVLRDVRLDANGVAATGWGPGGRTRPALIVSRDVMPPERPEPITWSEISRIETGRTSARRLGIGGLVVGSVLGIVVWKTIPLGYDGAPGSAPVVIGVPALTGLALGAFLGSQQYRWHTVYARGDAPGSLSRP
jgi:hypothetical protein